MSLNTQDSALNAYVYMNDNLWVETTVSFKAHLHIQIEINYQDHFQGTPSFINGIIDFFFLLLSRNVQQEKHFQLFLRKTGLLLNATPLYECTAGNIIRSWTFWCTTIRVKTLNRNNPWNATQWHLDCGPTRHGTRADVDCKVSRAVHFTSHRSPARFKVAQYTHTSSAD